MPTVTEQFTNNTAALSALVDAVNVILSSPIDASKLKGIDFDLTGLSDNDIIALKYDQTNNKFTASKIGIDENFKVDLTDVQDGYTLRYIAADNKFIAVSPVIGNSSGASYAPIQKIKVVPGDLISYFAGISEILQQSPLIPPQTEDSAQILKGQWHLNRYPWHAFDRDSSSFWNYYSVDTNDAILGFDFGASTTVGGYSVQIHARVNGFPTDWTFDGSNDSLNWTTLQTVAGEANWNDYESKFFGLAAPVEYRYFRLKFTDSEPKNTFRWNNNHYHFYVSELQLFPNNSAENAIQDIKGDISVSRTSRIFGLGQYGSEVFAIAGFAEKSDKIFAINANERAIVRDIELAEDNYGIAVNKTQTSGQFKFETIVTKHSGTIAINSTTGIGYIAIDNKIFAYNLTSGNLVATINCEAGDIQGTIVSGNKLYACSAGDNEIVVIDILTNTIDTTLTNVEGVGNVPWEIALHSGQGNIYVTFKNSNQVGVFDVVTDSIITTIAVGAKPTGIVVSELLDRAVVVNSAGGIVSIISTTSNSVIASVPVGVSAKPSAAAIDAANSKAFVACEGYHQVAVIDLTENILESRISVEPEPVDLVWVEATKELYCSSQNGMLTIITST
ncbi:MAG: discoidin domain-containing protein [Cyanobacteria bacterium SBLK]|nr:discoidin domain-containing protein [Cyanobacteria bacterium SBLK]